MKICILFVIFFISFGYSYSQKEVVDAIKEYRIEDVLAIDSIGGGYYIVSTMGDRKFRSFLVQGDEGSYKVKLMDLDTYQSYYQVGRYFLSDDNIYLIRWDKGNPKKNEPNRLYFDKMVDLKFPRSEQPVFETKENIGEDYFVTKDKVYIFYKGGYRGGYGDNYRVLKKTEHGACEINIIEFDKEDLKSGKIVKSEFTQTDIDANLFGNYSLQNAHMTIDNVLKREGSNIEIVIRSSENGLQSEIFKCDLGYDIGIVHTTHWVNGKYYILSMDADLNFHGVLLDLKSGFATVLSHFEMPYDKFVEEYEPEVKAEKNVKVDLAKTLEVKLTVNFDLKDDKEHFVMTSFRSTPTDLIRQQLYIATNCVVAKFEKDKIIWISNVARGYHQASQSYVSHVIGGQQKNLAPKMSSNEDHLILSDYEAQLYFFDGKFLYRPRPFSLNAKCYLIEIKLDKDTGTISRKIIKETLITDIPKK